MSRSSSEDELAFERLLLGAGVAEAVPAEQTEAALLRFTAGVAALQTGALGAAAMAGSTASGLSPNRWTRLLTASQWLALGAVAGGVATFAWFRLAPPPVHASRAPVVVTEQAAAAPTAVLAERAAPSSHTAVTVAAAATSSEPAPTTLPQTARAGRAPRATPAQPAFATSSADLAAEVAALDGVRTAISIGGLRDAELGLASYRGRFTRGSLRSEAEVLALELLVAQGRTQAAALAAKRFVEQHPRDPQVARVRALVE